MPTHYDTLGVDPSSSHDEIRRAYHDAARRWHPDRFVDRPEAEAERADDSMRAVNEAWRVLGDDARRRRYDTERTGQVPDRSQYVRTEDGVTRIDPRLLDPEFLAARRQAQEEAIEDNHSAALRVVPMLALFVLLVGIFVFTAYANGRAGTGPTDTVPGPAIGVEAGACVRILPGPQLLELPCDGLIDGRVVGAHEPGGVCPAVAIRTVELSNGITVCLGT